MALSIGELVGYVGLDTSKAESAADSLGGMFGKLGGQWGKVLGGAGLAGGAAFGAALVDAVGNEVGSDRLAASLGKGEKAAEAYGKIAGNVYSNGFGTGLEDVNTAIGAVVTSIRGMRNASDSEVQKMTERAMTYADIMGVDVTRAAQVAGNMVYNGLAKNGSQAFDLLMAASQKVPVQLREDVLDATDEYGIFFNQLGIKGPEAMGLLAKGAEQGMYGIDKAGDAIKEFTIRATDGSEATVGAFEGMGLNAQKMAEDLLAGGERGGKAFDKVVEGLLSIEHPTTRAKYALDLFGTPLEDLSTRDIPKFLSSLQGGEKTLGKFAGSVDKAGDTAYDNAATNLSMFGRTLRTEFVELVGGSVLPRLTELSGALASGLGPAFSTAGSAIKSVSGFLSEHKTLAASLAVGIAALVAITAAHGAVLAVTAAGGMVAWLKGTTLISTATKAWAAVQWVLNAALTANPIGLVIVALVALGVAITVAWKKSETFRSIVLAVWNAIKTSTVQAFEKVKDAVSTAFDFLRGVFLNFTGPGLIIKHWNTIKTTTTAVWEVIKGEVSGAIERVKGAIGGLASIPGKVAEWFGRAKDAVVEKWNAAVAFVAGIPGRITSSLGNLGSLLYNAGASILQGLIDGIQSKISALTSKLRAITSLIPKNKGPESKDKKLLRPNGKLIMGGLVDGILDGVGNLKSVLKDVTEGIGKKQFAKIEKAVKDEYARGLRLTKRREKLAKKLEAATGKLEEAVKLRNDFFDNVKSAAVAFAGLGNMQVDAEKGVTGGDIVTHMRSKLAEVLKFRTNMTRLVGMGLDDATYRQMLADGVDKAGAFAEALVADPAAVRGVADLSRQISDAADGLAFDSSQHLYQAGVDSAQKVVDGLVSQEQNVLKKMATLGEKMAKAIADALNQSLASVTKGTDMTFGVQPQGKGPKGKGPKDKDKSSKDKSSKDKNERTWNWTVNQAPNQSAAELAEKLWNLTRSRG